ncbi:MAG TPA: ADP-ribosylglycohydrolase family protein [Gemmatimonadales bacterium]
MPHDPTDLEQVVIAAFEALDWRHSERAGWRVARVQGEQSGYELAFRGDSESGLLLGYCLIPARVPAARRLAMAEAIVRVNFGLFLGGFDMDLADGELRYRVSVDVEGATLTPTMVHNMISASVSACDRFYGAFMRVMHGDVDPEEAIAAATMDSGDGAAEGEGDDTDGDAAGDGEAPPRDDPAAMRRAVHELLASLDATSRDEESEDGEDGASPEHARRSPRVGLASRRDREHVRGCLLGGAVGDALGAPVEFMTLDAIRARHGADGIRELDEAYGRVGAITDDTQMTLFTAEGLLRASARLHERGLCHPPSQAYQSYLRWLSTQGVAVKAPPGLELDTGWLVQVRALHARRGPGNTCLSALASGRMGTIEEPLNDSKGCGGVMRVAPAAVLHFGEPFRLGAEVAATTHGHPSGYLAAGAMTEILAHLLDGAALEPAVHAALDRLAREQGHEETTAALRGALDAWHEGAPSAERVERLGAGWVAEEALAIAVYCALSAGDDFAAGARLAVNHSGDSDSTGAVTGNLLGALLGASAIPERWLEQLELRREIEEIADDLLEGYRDDDAWRARYPGP